MDIPTGKYLTAMFEFDQLSAQVTGDLPLEDLFAQYPVEAQPHENIQDGCKVICPYSRQFFLCPLDKRLTCAELECTYWLNKLEEE